MSREDFEKWASPEFVLTIGRIRVGRYMLADTRAAWAGWQAALQHRGEVTVTKNAEGQIVCVSRNDADGRILSVIAEATPQPVVVPDALSFDEALSSEAITYRKGWNACRTVMLLAGIKDEATPQPAVDQRCMNPRLWTKEMSDAWWGNIPNLQKAFDALLSAGKKNE
jgi:hypothetical protein